MEPVEGRVEFLNSSSVSFIAAFTIGPIANKCLDMLSSSPYNF
jgi:hypothetical protein